jgi:hypothetical protein
VIRIDEEDKREEETERRVGHRRRHNAMMPLQSVKTTQS